MVRKRKDKKKEEENNKETKEKLITQIDIKDAEKLLAQAKAALVDDHSVKALNFAKAAQEVARGMVWRYERALNSINLAQEVITEANRSGIEIEEAWNLFNLAKGAMENREYDKAFVFAERAKFACKPEPIIGKDIVLKTAIGYEAGMITYKVGVGNKMDYPIEKISIKPYLEAMFDSDAEERVITNIAPQQTQVVTFVLIPTTNYQEVITSGEAMLGRDMKVQTITTYENGNFLYKVRLENSMEVSIEEIKVIPYVPKGFISVVEEEKIELLQPHDTKTIIFKLLPENVMQPVTVEEQPAPSPLEWQAIQPKEGTMTQIEREEPIKEVPKFLPVTKERPTSEVKWKETSEEPVPKEEQIEILKELKEKKEPILPESPIELADEEFLPTIEEEDELLIEKVQEKLEEKPKEVSLTEEIPPPPTEEKKEQSIEEIQEPEKELPTDEDKTTSQDKVKWQEESKEGIEDLGEEEWGSDWDLFKSLDERRKKILEKE